MANSSDGGDNQSEQRCALSSTGVLFHFFFNDLRPVDGDPIAPGDANSVGLPLSNSYCLRFSSLSFQSFELQLELKLLLKLALLSFFDAMVFWTLVLLGYCFGWMFSTTTIKILCALEPVTISLTLFGLRLLTLRRAASSEKKDSRGM